MNKLSLVFFALCIIVFSSCEKNPAGENAGGGPSVTIMSFNVRSMSMTEEKNEDKWENRRDACCAMINYNRPVMMGVQECQKAQRDYIKSRCRGYEVVGRSVSNDSNDSQTAIFYLKDSIQVIDCGTFWLTDTPDVVSKLEGDKHYRTATWIKARHITSDKVFYHINTHMDNCSTDNRVVEMRYLLGFVDDNCEDFPVVMTADWNEEEDHWLFNSLYESFKNARYTAKSTDRGTTFNGFGAHSETWLIDHIFYKGFGSCSKFAADRQAWAGHAYISDHYPIYAILNF